MPTVACPNCGHPTPRTLSSLGDWPSVRYHVCDSCHHVWTTTRDGSSIISHVTPLSPIKPTE